VTTLAAESGVVQGVRFNIAFSPGGRFGACLLAGEEGLVLEQWRFTAEHTECETVPDVALGRRTHPLPLDDGRILLLHSEGTETSGRHSLVLLESAGGSDLVPRHLADVAGLTGQLVPSPGPDELGFLVTLDDPHGCTLWRVSDSPPHVEAVLWIPGVVSGGVWLDGDGGLLALNQAGECHRSSGVVVDLAQRSWRRIWSVSKTSIDRIVLASPCSKRLVLTTTSAGGERLGWAVLGEPAVHFPEALHRPGYLRHALALDETGEQLLVGEVAGAVSRLFVYNFAEDRLSPVAGPLGTVSTPACWTGDLVRLRFSAPHRPATPATLWLDATAPEAAPRWSVGEEDASGPEHGWARAELIRLPGPAGSIEAIVYGGTGWRNSPHLVLALHGGPLSSWRFEFDPLFQSLAGQGVAVVAPNYRGSTGYGDEHLRAVVGNWGEPDLQDVLELGRGLTDERGGGRLPKPVVLGSSYGAFLALLAAAHAPQLWSGCVALAPFVSGPSLYACAGIAVRSRVAALGGLRQADDAVGPRDVLAGSPSLTVPLLLAHGSDDETIPVEQSRSLWRRLVELGRVEGVDFEYVETGGGHQEVAMAYPTDLRRKVMSFCLACSRPMAGGPDR